MREIIARLPQCNTKICHIIFVLIYMYSALFEVVIFGDQVILHEPVESWPVVEALIAFYSSGYPLAKALEYVELRKPYLINDLRTQFDLQDRRKVYAVLHCKLVYHPHVLIFLVRFCNELESTYPVMWS